MKHAAVILASIGLLAGAAHGASSAPARRAIAEGNALAGRGEWPAARAQYSAAVEADPLSPEAWYNRACAEREAGEIDAAAASFREAERLTRDGALAGSSAYNLGVLAFERARGMLEQSPAESLASLRDSAAQFRRALERNPADRDAARNIEVVNRSIRAIEEMLEQMEQQRQQQQELAEQLEQMADQQRREAEETESRPSPSEQMQQRKDQQELSEQTEQAREAAEQAAEQNPQDQPAQDAKKALEEARQAQEEAERAMEEGRPQDAAQKQREAADRLREAAEQLSRSAQERRGEGEAKEGEQAERQEADAPQDQQNAKEGEGEAQAPDPTERLVESLLNKEQRERERRRADQRARQPGFAPVERDW
ncbi:MAG: tetratricopeptide repeat protein [Phycisphaerales bacterium]|nr:tetratricopeptide repeat protein [Phycisphaerales bacterium]